MSIFNTIFKGDKEGAPPILTLGSNIVETRPQVFVEEPSRLPVHVTVHFAKQYVPNIQVFTKRWRTQKQPEYSPKQKKKRFNICRWYKRKRALNKQEKENRRKEIEEAKRRREEWERERVNELLRWEFGKRQREEARKKDTPIPDTPIPQKTKIVDKRQKEISRKKEPYITIPQEMKYEEKRWTEIEKKKEIYIPAPLEEKKKETTVKKVKYKPISWSPKIRNNGFFVQKRAANKTEFKEQSANVKPRSVAKKVYVKKYSARDSIASRFVNCFYRVCCQFYCCLTCVTLIALAYILL